MEEFVKQGETILFREKPDRKVMMGVAYLSSVLGILLFVSILPFIFSTLSLFTVDFWGGVVTLVAFGVFALLSVIFALQPLWYAKFVNNYEYIITDRRIIIKGGQKKIFEIQFDSIASITMRTGTFASLFREDVSNISIFTNSIVPVYVNYILVNTPMMYSLYAVKDYKKAYSLIGDLVDKAKAKK